MPINFIFFFFLFIYLFIFSAPKNAKDKKSEEKPKNPRPKNAFKQKNNKTKTETKETKAKISVSNLPKEITEEDLMTIFGDLAKPESISIQKNKDHAVGVGYYKDDDTAIKALEQLKKETIEVNGQVIQFELARAKKSIVIIKTLNNEDKEDHTCLYLKKLGRQVKFSALKDYYKDFSPKITFNSQRLFAVIIFSSEQDCEAALKLGLPKEFGDKASVQYKKAKK